MINSVAPVAAKPTPQGAVFGFTYLSFTGTGMLIAAIISGFLMGFSPAKVDCASMAAPSSCVRFR